MQEACHFPSQPVADPIHDRGQLEQVVLKGFRQRHGTHTSGEGARRGPGFSGARSRPCCQGKRVGWRTSLQDRGVELCHLFLPRCTRSGYTCVLVGLHLLSVTVCHTLLLFGIDTEPLNPGALAFKMSPLDRVQASGASASTPQRPMAFVHCSVTDGGAYCASHRQDSMEVHRFLLETMQLLERQVMITTCHLSCGASVPFPSF